MRRPPGRIAQPWPPGSPRSGGPLLESSCTHGLLRSRPVAYEGHTDRGTPVDEIQPVARARRRFFRRVDPPVWPFVWRGFLPVLGLIALVLFGVSGFAWGWIEKAVEWRTRAALDAAGLGWAHLEVSGQQVMLSGVAPAPADGVRALEVARGARCPSWAGELVCAISVRGAFEATAPGPAPEPASPAPAEPGTALQAEACEGGLAALLGASRVEFAFGSAQLEPSAGPLLDRVAEVARECPGTLQVEGHTDSTGDEATNLALSRARAEAVRQALVERGLEPARLTAAGFGAARPVASNAEAAGRARNRRIEVHVTAVRR